MEPRQQPLRMYGHPAGHEPLAWAWVREQLATAPTYWVVARGPGHPHPRPVWGVWHDDVLYLSLGSPALLAAVGRDADVTVHLDSGTDVVIVEGTAGSDLATPAAVVAAYDRKYTWSYDTGSYGQLTVVRPGTVLAWRTAGWAGRDSFVASGRWRFASTAP
ncbi:MAG TPA: hypothetical protein VJT31_25740 [Rugosimonospora sp.]|nr:hypothetical protein [Rugosimonospora sp.]